MTKIYFINGKKVDLDSSEWNRIYFDGTWSNEGFNLFWRKKDNCFILEHWSNWQGVGSSVSLLNRKEAIDELLNHTEAHPKRVNEAFETIGYIPKIF